MKSLIIGLVSLNLIIPVEFVYAQSCFEATVVSPNPFMGNNGEIIKLDDGTIWQVKNAYEYLYEYTPNVIVCPSKGKLIIKNKSIDIQAISTKGNVNEGKQGITESSITNDFNGLEMGNIYVLANGEIWEQVEAWIWAWTWENPSVLIYPEAGGFKMKAEKIEHPVLVRRIK